MAKLDPKLRLHAAPFLRGATTTPRVMIDVIIALVPIVAASVWFFGAAALLVLCASTAGAVAAERLFARHRFNLADGSVILTGVLLGLTLPPALPLWIAFLGGMVAIGLGRVIWGGLGNNMFNPALVGRAFLLATFPQPMTTWSTPGGLGDFFEFPKTTFAWPLMKAGVDVVSAATPLAMSKSEHVATSATKLLVGNTSGSLGETAAVLIILGGLYLIYRRACDWRIPLSILLTVVAFAGVLYWINAAKYPTPWFMLCSGGLLLGAIFMATDPVTSPMSPVGAWIFGIGIGILVVLIRLFGGLPEGVMYAILLMNAGTPLIERYVRPRPFGRKRRT